MSDRPTESSETPEDRPRAAEDRARLAAIVESSDDAIVSKSLDGVIRTWNKGAERIFGYTSEEVVGRPITIIIPPDQQEEEPRILERLRGGQRVDHFETVRVTKDGRQIEVSVTISPVRDETGRIIGASKIARDITEQNRLRRELEAAKEAAESANRAKDDFLSVLSHELRTPLTPALAAISYMETQADQLPEELREQVGMLRRSIETEARLVDDLLDATRIARSKVHLHFEAVDAHAALRGAVTMLQSEIDAKAMSVTVALRARDYLVWADPGRLQQVLLNLLSNAVKFTPAGGAITVRSSQVREGRVLLEVSDTGVGIDPAELPRLFKPFEQGERTVTRQFGGLGLGLSIVRSLVEMHCGTVGATSAGHGRGSTFGVDLPTIPRPPLESPRPTASVADPGQQRPHVLLVEDHTDTREVLKRLLASFGFLVTAAGSVREALELSRRHRFSLLVSDIGLPDGSGMEIIRHLKAQQEIRGIALSGFGHDDDLRRSREAGFERHLVKPVNFHVLRDVIQKMIN